MAFTAFEPSKGELCADLATAYTAQEKSGFSLFKLHHLDLAIVTNCYCQVIGGLGFLFLEKLHRSNSKVL